MFGRLYNSPGSSVYVVAHNGSAMLGGGEIWTAKLLAGLQSRGHRVLVLCRDRSMAARIASYGVPAAVQRIGGDLVFTDALRLAARLRAERPDALILTTFKKVLLAGTAARLAAVPRVVQRIVLDGDTPARGARYRWAFRHLVDVTVLNAESLRPAFDSPLSGINPLKVVVEMDGVPTPQRTSPSGSLRARLGISPDAKVIGSVTRLAKQKRLDRLIRVMAALPSEVECIIAGEGDDLASLHSLCEKLGVAERVHFIGFHRNVGDVLDALDLFVVCSDREGMANSMLEAMASGVPVISTPVSGAAEALNAPINGGVAPGRIVDFDDDSIARGVKDLLGNPAERHEMARAGRRYAEEKFSFETMLDRWEALLADAPRAKKTPRPAE